MYPTGASTAEAQQRVAVEIAQQFVALARKSTEYAVTGIVNAPMLSAAINDENTPWLELSKKLGKLAARFLKGKLNVPVQIRMMGCGMQEKAFVRTAVLVGVLSGQTQNGLNLINAPMLAQEIGVNLQVNQVEADYKAVLVQVDGHQIKGE